MLLQHRPRTCTVEPFRVEESEECHRGKGSSSSFEEEILPFECVSVLLLVQSNRESCCFHFSAFSHSANFKIYIKPSCFSLSGILYCELSSEFPHHRQRMLLLFLLQVASDLSSSSNVLYFSSSSVTTTNCCLHARSSSRKQQNWWKITKIYIQSKYIIPSCCGWNFKNFKHIRSPSSTTTRHIQQQLLKKLHHPTTKQHLTGYIITFTVYRHILYIRRRQLYLIAFIFTFLLREHFWYFNTR